MFSIARGMVWVGGGCAFVGISVSSVSALAGQAGAASEPAIVYHGEAKMLNLDATCVAIRVDRSDRGVAAARVEAAVAAAGLVGAVVEAYPISGWFLVRLPAVPGVAARDLNAIRAIVAVISRSRLYATPVFIDDFGGPLLIAPDLMVGFEPGTAAGKRDAALAACGAGALLARDWNELAGVDFVSGGSLDGFRVLAVARALAAMPGVAFAEPDTVFTGRSLLIPNDPLFAQCWGLRNTGQSGGLADFDMDAEEAWDITAGSSSVITAIIDTGVDVAHPDLNLVAGNDFTGASPADGTPKNSFDNHGTAVAGCVSARINNGLGVVGVAPGTRSASARTFVSTNSSGNWTSSASWTVDALTWASTIGARVTNNSNGYGFTSSAIEAAYASTRNNGIVHFASAGNSGTSGLGYPASVPTVNAVAATNRFGQRASFSTWGPGLDFSAPGQDINSTDRLGSPGYVSGDYAVVNGTSFASPYTAGVAALVVSQCPGLTAIEVERVMQRSATDLGAPGYETNFGWGHVNARAALDLVRKNPIGTQPSEAVVCATGSASYSIAASGVSALSFQWQYRGGVATDWINLANGVNSVGGEFVLNATGVSTVALSVNHSPSAWANSGEVRCVVSGVCASVTSNVAALRVCAADFDCNGFLAGDDFDQFVAAFELGAASADFDGDGFVTGDDFDAFVAAFGEGC